MAKHADLSIDFLGFKCENPFFLSSSPVSGTYEMCAKFLEAGGGGVFYKTLTTTIPEECSPRFDAPRKEATPFISFKNMEQTSDKPYQDNLDAMKKLKENYPSGAGECVSLSTLYAAVLFVVGKIPLDKIYLLATPLHSQNFIDIKDLSINKTGRCNKCQCHY